MAATTSVLRHLDGSYNECASKMRTVFVYIFVIYRGLYMCHTCFALLMYLLFFARMYILCDTFQCVDNGMSSAIHTMFRRFGWYSEGGAIFDTMNSIRPAYIREWRYVLLILVTVVHISCRIVIFII